MRKLLALCATVTFVSVGASAAGAGTPLLVGFGDNWMLDNPTAAIPVARDLGAAGFRVALPWAPGETELAPGWIRKYDTAIPAAFGMRIVVVVTGRGRTPPKTAAARTDYCNYVRDLLERYPTINDIVIWNEPNKTANWQPQFVRGRSAAPAAYGLLLARCWDILHAFRSNVNILAPAASPNGNDNPRAVSNISHSPENFIRRLGAAYRATRRTKPIFDNVVHHMYGSTPSERPWRKHSDRRILTQGDHARLVSTLRTAFAGTRQPVPGRCLGGRCALIWYLEAGYQTSIDRNKRRLYRFRENVPRTVPDNAGGERGKPDADSRAPDQATQIVDGVRLAYCQRYVAAFFNYLLRDDRDLRMWQSGPLWRDGTKKDSYSAFKRVFREVRTDSVDCSELKGGPLPQP